MEKLKALWDKIPAKKQALVAGVAVVVVIIVVKNLS